MITPLFAKLIICVGVGLLTGGVAMHTRLPDWMKLSLVFVIVASVGTLL